MEGHAAYFRLPRGCPGISHSLFADDTIIFSRGLKGSLKQIMGFLSRYEGFSGQLVNKQKSCFVVGHKATLADARMVGAVTGFSQKALPITYLGAPLHCGRLMVCFFDVLIDKINSKVAGWKGCMASLLTFSGEPWNGGNEGTGSAGRNFFKAKFFKGLHVVLVDPHGVTSRSWMNALAFRGMILERSRWLDNWSEAGRLIDAVDNALLVDVDLRVKDAVEGDGSWRQDILDHIDDEAIRQAIVQGNVHISDRLDVLVWAPASDGRFSTKSVWNEIRMVGSVAAYAKWIWNPSLPTKVAFFSWQLLNGKIPTEVTLMSVGIPLASRCYYYGSPQRETIDHCLIGGVIAAKVWRFFSRLFDLVPHPGQDVRGRLALLHGLASYRCISDYIVGLLPALIVWELWKERNNRRYGETRRTVSTIIDRVRRWVKELPIPSQVGKRGSARDGLIQQWFELVVPPAKASRPIPVFELRALRDGLRLCHDRGYVDVLVHSDSETTVTQINHKKCNLWQGWYWFDEILQLMAATRATVTFAFRESNRAADWLFNLLQIRLRALVSVPRVETAASERKHLLLVKISELEARMIDLTDQVAEARLKHLQLEASTNQEFNQQIPMFNHPLSCYTH
ncbi:uncharacterized protein LOC122647603 [Telopea speciosissima]|uniref:uncharacterized protein LOC122647603 n=1 Tax=Telopea speciosissima TaxID=54955 RepID=UPI001CC5074C|nr:uncharacterized protein LOC122647603 [Telopea speciosissima]